VPIFLPSFLLQDFRVDSLASGHEYWCKLWGLCLVLFFCLTSGNLATDDSLVRRPGLACMALSCHSNLCCRLLRFQVCALGCMFIELIGDSCFPNKSVSYMGPSGLIESTGAWGFHSRGLPPSMLRSIFVTRIAKY